MFTIVGLFSVVDVNAFASAGATYFGCLLNRSLTGRFLLRDSARLAIMASELIVYFR